MFTVSPIIIFLLVWFFKLLVTLLSLRLIENILFYIFNRRAYIEYRRVVDDVENNRISHVNSDYIEYNQELKYVSIRPLFNFIVSGNNRDIKSSFYVVPPYLSFCNDRSRCDIFDKIFECNIFNWRRSK